MMSPASIDWFSPAQCMGYLAFFLGVGSFLQTDDKRFKLFMFGECATYVVHFALLGNPTAVISSVLSAIRSLLALKTRAWWVALGVIAANIAFGLWIAQKPSDWLPLLASCIGTYALFFLQGIAMRVVMLLGTSLWITNNLLSGSVGGTALEIVVALVNISTIYRMHKQK